MALANPGVVDLVTVFPGDAGRVALIIYDGGEITEPNAREAAMQAKLVSYLKFVVSGQFAKSYSQFLDRELCIFVVCAEAPTDGMKNVKGIRDRVHPETFLPVEVITHDEFRESYLKPKT